MIANNAGGTPSKPHKFFERHLDIDLPSLKEFLEEIERKTKYKPVIYSGYQFYKEHLLGNFDEYPLWIAHYYQPKLKLSESTNWFFWQHADNAHIDGILGKVDMNVFKSEEEDLSAFLIQKSNY